MIDRQFSEIDLRHMLEYATVLREDVVVGRWIVESWLRRQPWEVIVEPDLDARVIVVVTAYPVR